MIDRLVALIAQARAATNGEELDRRGRRDAESDAAAAEKDSADQSALAAFSRALDQARQAIAGRRRVFWGR